MRILRQWAIRYAFRLLEGHGYVVVPRTFVGVLVGYGFVRGTRHDMKVSFPDHLMPMHIAINQTVCSFMKEDGNGLEGGADAPDTRGE